MHIETTEAVVGSGPLMVATSFTPTTPKRAGRMHKKLRTYLGRVMRDIDRKIKGNDVLRPKCARLLSLARRVHQQQQHQRGPKVYSLHAPEVECIGKGKPHRPYELMAWTTPAPCGTVAIQAANEEDMPCLRTRWLRSASTWERISSISSG
jgi:hypothetical protein